MLRKYLLPIFALLGALLALGVVIWSQRTTPAPPILFPPPQSPYPYFIAGAGIIEASSQNISVGSPFDQIIEKIFVIEGDNVNKGDPLFQLDHRAFQPAVDIARASYNAALVQSENAKVTFSFYQNLKDRRAVSEESYQQAYYAHLQAEENVKVANANLVQAETNLERSIIRAPVSGQILQVNSHIGEIAPIIPFISNQSTWLAAANGTIILMGVVNPLQLRIDIDSDDAWRYKKGARAVAFVRGNSHINFPLTFSRVEPYVIPKSSFTGATIERVDTRVLQVLYNFSGDDLPIYAGQILDIFIEAEAIEKGIHTNS